MSGFIYSGNWKAIYNARIVEKRLEEEIAFVILE